jgi:hypothetical protein
MWEKNMNHSNYLNSQITNIQHIIFNYIVIMNFINFVSHKLIV